MKHFVKVKNGIVVDGPKVLSDNPSDSPNSQWKNEQLSLNSYFIVDLACDECMEKIDYANPVVSKDSVTYKRIALTQTEMDEVFNQKQIQNRVNEYPSSVKKLDSLWAMIAEGDETLMNEVKSKIEEVNLKYPLK
jgi:hypothetical protein